MLWTEMCPLKMHMLKPEPPMGLYEAFNGD